MVYKKGIVDKEPILADNIRECRQNGYLLCCLAHNFNREQLKYVAGRSSKDKKNSP